jgi:hypothetical protein
MFKVERPRNHQEKPLSQYAKHGKGILSRVCLGMFYAVQIQGSWKKRRTGDLEEKT